jgi:hypothetical protein
MQVHRPRPGHGAAGVRRGQTVGAGLTVGTS